MTDTTPAAIRAWALDGAKCWNPDTRQGAIFRAVAELAARAEPVADAVREEDAAACDAFVIQWTELARTKQAPPELAGTQSDLLRRLARYAREGGWCGMDSAPRDGTHVLGWGEVAGEINGHFGQIEYVVMSWRGGRTDYPGYDWSVHGGDAYACWVKPTHWRPLPAPPQEG